MSYETRALLAMPENLPEETNIKVIREAIVDMEPKDSIEMRLCSQLTSLYAQSMNYLSKADKADMLCHKEFYLKSSMKLLRLHNETIEALSKYRRQGEQKIIVQHVNVENGAKALVGNFLQ